MDRTVILHIHLFKNAGTSLDGILEENFGRGWVAREFSTEGRDNSRAVADWIRERPDAVAFSTHTAVGPLPDIPGVRIVSVMLLRDPIARIRSAYRFERQQAADTWGAALAKKTDFAGYVLARLSRPGDRQCRNFQTERLAGLVPGAGPELDRAFEGLRRLSVVGRVEAFDEAVARLADAVRPAFPGFRWESARRNVSEEAETDDPEIEEILRQANQDDLALLEHLARTRLA